ncbi:MAG: hypothetical protein AAGA48_35250 [Myxococcota bacterium]
MHRIPATFVALALVACATPEPEETPLEGPGFDAETGELVAKGETFIVGLTHLQVRNLPGPGGRFGDHANAVGDHLFENEPEGWLGAAFRNVGRLNWWTMTVWESEEAMLRFVVSEPHAQAVADFWDITVGGEHQAYEATREELPVQWSRGMELLLESNDTVVLGDSKWFANGGEL